MHVEQQLRRCRACGCAFAVQYECLEDRVPSTDEERQSIRRLRCPNPACGCPNDVAGVVNVRDLTVKPLPYALPT